MTKRRRVLLGVAAVVVVGGGIAWRYQSEIIGTTTHWYLERVAAQETAAGDLTRRRQVVAGMHRLLLMPPPPDTLVPELFQVVTELSRRAATGAMSLNWTAYVYSTYYRNMVRDRPEGKPARDEAAVQAEIERNVEFFALQKRPDVAGVRVSDLLGVGDDSYTLEEIEKAEREGKELPLK